VVAKKTIGVQGVFRQYHTISGKGASAPKVHISEQSAGKGRGNDRVYQNVVKRKVQLIHRKEGEREELTNWRGMLLSRKLAYHIRGEANRIIGSGAWSEEGNL